jgi:dihydrofolate reductase
VGEGKPGRRAGGLSVTQYYLAQSLDGYIAESDHSLDWLDEYGADSEEAEGTEGSYDAFYAQVGAVAMGSSTYEFVLREASRWPYDVPSWVFTSRDLPLMDGADIRFADGPVGPVHDEMRAAAGERNVWVAGGGDLASRFVDAGLLDELHVTIVPVVLGDGIPTFARRLPGDLKLLDHVAFANGMLHVRYALPR